jgi:precorrin isomerase
MINTLSVSEMEIRGSINTRSFLENFVCFYHKTSPYVEEIYSRYLRSNLIISDGYASIFTYYKYVLDEAELDPDVRDDLECENGIFVDTEMVHWGVSVSEVNTKRATFYVYYEDWAALFAYLSTIEEESEESDVNVEFKIVNGYLIVNNEFELKLYD